MVFFFSFFFLIPAPPLTSPVMGVLCPSDQDRNIKDCFSWKCFMDNLVWNTFMLSCTVNDFDLHLGRITSCVESCSLKSAPNMQPEGTVCYSTRCHNRRLILIQLLAILPYTLPSILGLPDCGANSKAAFTPNLFSLQHLPLIFDGALWDSCNGRQCIRRQLSS